MPRYQVNQLACGQSVFSHVTWGQCGGAVGEPGHTWGPWESLTLWGCQAAFLWENHPFSPPWPPRGVPARNATPSEGPLQPPIGRRERSFPGRFGRVLQWILEAWVCVGRKGDGVSPGFQAPATEASLSALVSLSVSPSPALPTTSQTACSSRLRSLLHSPRPVGLHRGTSSMQPP